jgi:hypothetical protein
MPVGSYTTDISKSAARPAALSRNQMHLRQDRQEAKSAKNSLGALGFLAVLARSMPRKNSSWREKKENISIAATGCGISKKSLRSC